MAQADEVFGNHDKSLKWLHRPLKALEGQAPLDGTSHWRAFLSPRSSMLTARFEISTVENALLEINIMQNQANQTKNQAIVDFAESIFDIGNTSVRDIDPNGQWVVFESYGFNYEIGPMFLDTEAVEMGAGHSVVQRFAGDDGSNREITVQSFTVGEQACLVEYDVWQPLEYSDEDWVCSGTLTLTLVAADAAEKAMAEKVESLRQMSFEHALHLAETGLASAVDGERSLADVLAGLLRQLDKHGGYFYDVKTDTIEQRDAKIGYAIYEAGKAAGKRLDSAWGGAFVASLLVEHPAVESFRIEFDTSQEYDDNNYYTAKNVVIADLAFVGGATEALWPEDAEKVDASQYAESMQDEIDDNGDSWTLYDAFQPEAEPDDFQCVVRRADLAHLLDAEEIDGLRVAEIIGKTALEK